MPFEIQFAESVAEQLEVLTAAERSRVLDVVGSQLTNEPYRETRNRKPLRPNPLAPWELRVGPLRVFYEVATDRPAVVRILAVGKKERSILRIGRKEIQL